MLAKRPCQPTSMLNVTPHSRASPLPHLICGASRACERHSIRKKRFPCNDESIGHAQSQGRRCRA
ncbi:hypothetical protein C1X65_23010 [Pseudomonas sp. FW305-70]|nr:hypothetical protein C1X65_23010 [Pseudomonas sp. FW305-70]